MWELSSNVISMIGIWSPSLSSVTPNPSSKLILWLLSEQFCIDLSRYFDTVSTSRAAILYNTLLYFFWSNSPECFQTRGPGREIILKGFKVQNGNEETWLLGKEKAGGRSCQAHNDHWGSHFVHVPCKRNVLPLHARGIR